MQDDFKKAMLFDYPEKLPVRISILPAVRMKYGNEINDLMRKHPYLFSADKINEDYANMMRDTYREGDHTDAWGCVWSNVCEGMEALVTGHPVQTREQICELELPKEDIGFPHGFMFLRLTDLRGFENAMMDFAEEPPELQILIDKVLQYNLRQLDIRLKNVNPGDMVYFGDDNGIQSSLPISPNAWRKYIKPCYAAIYGPCREKGCYVYMHTDGHIYEIIPDLVECGVTIINPQYRANGIENLKRACKGKVCVDLDLDRQLFPFASPAEIEDHIFEAVDVMDSPEGGLWLKAEISPDIPIENIEAICNALEKASQHRATSA